MTRSPNLTGDMSDRIGTNLLGRMGVTARVESGHESTFVTFDLDDVNQFRRYGPYLVQVNG